jgi:hypothetical protein
VAERFGRTVARRSTHENLLEFSELVVGVHAGGSFVEISKLAMKVRR